MLIFYAGLLLLVINRSPAAAAPVGSDHVAPRAQGTCTHVVIRLPDVITLYGDQGAVTASVRTNLAPGEYRIRYKPASETFIIDPWDNDSVVVHAWLAMPNPQHVLYKEYLASMIRPVPLLVENAQTSGTSSRINAPCQNCSSMGTPLGALSAGQAMALIGAAGASAREQGWARLIANLAEHATQPISAEQIKQTLEQHKRQAGIANAPARTTHEVVDDPALHESWRALHAWEKALWRDYLPTYGDTADVTAARDDLHITHDMRLSMALRMTPRYMKPGAREAAEILFNDPLFLGATVIGVSAYLALWVAPEPVFSKAAAVMTTIGLVALAGFTAAEITALAHAWMRLKGNSAKARTLAELERAAEQFGKALGGSALRILVALATMMGGKAIPIKPTGAAPVTIAPAAAAGTRGTTLVAGAAQAGWTIKVLSGGAIVIVPGAMAMSVVHGGSGGSGSDGGSKPPKTSHGSSKAAKPSGKSPAAKDSGTAANVEMSKVAAKPRAPSSRALGRALEAAGHVRPPGAAAHHIVAGSAPGARSARATLRRLGIGINDAMNGVFLPAKQHAALHTNAYYTAVNKALEKVTTRGEAIQVLQSIGQALRVGNFP